MYLIHFDFSVPFELSVGRIHHDPINKNTMRFVSLIRNRREKKIWKKILHSTQKSPLPLSFDFRGEFYLYISSWYSSWKTTVIATTTPFERRSSSFSSWHFSFLFFFGFVWFFSSFYRWALTRCALGLPRVRKYKCRDRLVVAVERIKITIKRRKWKKKEEKLSSKESKRTASPQENGREGESLSSFWHWVLSLLE